VKKFKAFFLLLTLAPSLAMAEYRVYQYYVRSKHQYSMDQQSYLVTSSLNPVSYQAYHGGADALEVDLVRTWSCPGHTGGMKNTCPAPLEAMESGQTAGQ
jgi:hypothetical protein